MARIFTWLIISAVSLLLLFSCSKKNEISELDVKRVVKNLSSDSLKGRHAFKPEIHLAADLISSEFETIGLAPLPGHDGYRQNFNVYTIHPDSVSVIINNNPLDGNHYFGLLNTESLSWRNGDVDVLTISEEDNFRERFKELTSDRAASLVVVDKTHKKWFHRYRSYYSGKTRTFELDKKPSDVFILCSPDVTEFNIFYKSKITAAELFNVTGIIEGRRSDEIVLFTAHYDHIGVITPVGRDSIANGANDNASGVAAVIELARHYSNRPKPERTIYFVAFTAEESGGYGSRYFAEQINPDHIVAMFNIEMIGKPALEGPHSAWITGFEYSSFGEILQNSMDDSSFVFYADPYPGQNLFYRSDNAALARLGVPAHTISTTPINVDRDYHQTSDEFQTVQIPHITNTIQAIAKASRVIISGDETPTRIHPDSLNH